MNPVIFSIGSFELRYYGLMYAIAFFVGIEIAKYMAKERNFNPSKMCIRDRFYSRLHIYCSNFKLYTQI